MNYSLEKFHPSFHPVAQKLFTRDRGMYSPYTYVEWWPEWQLHGHNLWLGSSDGGNEFVNGGSVEEAAEELADLVANCKPSELHGGHLTNVNHPENEQEMAYKKAVDQLVSTPYDTEWVYGLWLERMFEKWGGHMPAAVLMPVDNPDDWGLMIPNIEGDPIMHSVNQNLLGDIPYADPSRAEKNPFLGYSVKPDGFNRVRAYRKLWNRRQRLTGT